MASLNRVVLIGNLTRDPDLRYTPSGTAWSKFSIAINRKYKNGDDWKEEVTYVEIVAWGKQGEACSEYLVKGRPVCVEGRLKLDQWVTESGDNRSKLGVVAEKVVFLGGNQSHDNQSRGYGHSKQDNHDPHMPPHDDDVPF